MDLFMPQKDLLLRSWDFFLKLIAAIAVFVIGWLVAKLIKAAVVKVLKALKLDSIAEQLKISDFLSRGGIKYTLSEIIGVVIYWIFLLGVLISSLNVLELTGVSSLLDRLLLYVPNVIGAMIILIVGIFIATFVASIARTAAVNAGLSQADMLGKMIQAVIIIFTLIIVLDELRVGAVLISAMNIILASIGLAVALAFGLGCKEIAAKYVSELIDKFKSKK
ncbi:MAG: hypothetical protein WC469_04385 [Candidatus Omnitrophota bacterium]